VTGMRHCWTSPAFPEYGPPVQMTVEQLADAITENRIPAAPVELVDPPKKHRSEADVWLERRAEAKGWLTKFVEDYGIYDGVERLIADAGAWGGHDSFTLRGSGGDDAAQAMRGDRGLCGRFWDCIEAVTGNPVPEGVRQTTSYVCSC
jgi:hypothetical protein